MREREREREREICEIEVVVAAVVLPHTEREMKPANSGR